MFKLQTPKVLLIISAILLASCGGSSSSSGSDSSEAANLAGVYTGNAVTTFNLTGGGINDSTQDNVFLTLTVSSNGNVNIVDGDGSIGAVRATGKLSGSNFSASGTATETESGVTCTFNPKYTGSIANSIATGRTNGTGTCTGQGRTVNVNFTNSFNLTKTTNAKSSGRSLFDAIKQSIR